MAMDPGELVVVEPYREPRLGVGPSRADASWLWIMVESRQGSVDR